MVVENPNGALHTGPDPDPDPDPMRIENSDPKTTLPPHGIDLEQSCCSAA